MNLLIKFALNIIIPLYNHQNVVGILRRLHNIIKPRYQAICCERLTEIYFVTPDQKDGVNIALIRNSKWSMQCHVLDITVIPSCYYLACYLSPNVSV